MQRKSRKVTAGDLTMAWELLLSARKQTEEVKAYEAECQEAFDKLTKRVSGAEAKKFLATHDI